ncbi:ankyrin repeat domain-containing protein SOWAHB isoform X3 [Photinus pyralis]|uniref:ankyrin repeat domain-containing protein SOWAHB isoform X3 n=1 Tax=Photinus pyralis TaxID=7054 RepID=UPI00126745CA|nr:ankyrin repeat domain-containing protein SOWAHB isoform X3 [Photinus pyralis]
MAANELSIDVIRDYFIEKGGIVSNRDVVKHFKRYLTDPSTRDEARTTFKKLINTLATTKTEGDEKFLILKPKYSLCPDLPAIPITSPKPCLDPINSIGIPVSPSHSIQDASPRRQPPPYRPPPPPPPTTPSPNVSCDNISISSSISLAESIAPQAPPRRRNSEKSKMEEPPRDDCENPGVENDKQPISVKERTQKFNRMASVEDELSPRNQKGRKIPDKCCVCPQGADEDDGASVTSLDPKKCTEWLVTAAKGDYQELAKLASDDPRLVKLKDPFTYTVLHWGAKHGNEDIIKLFAGKYKADVNSRTNGGYTPLHMAVQFGHSKVFNLLVEVYHADPDVRDFSGRMPEQYKISETQNSNKDTYKIKSRKKLADKDLRFLRIGSLNVRVKRTTEAFSNFLGVGGGSSINPTDLSGKVYKSWGSADNLSQDNLMPAPKNYAGKRKMKKSESTGVCSTPGTPSQVPRGLRSRNSLQDSDSDTAAGFDSQWKN